MDLCGSLCALPTSPRQKRSPYMGKSTVVYEALDLYGINLAS